MLCIKDGCIVATGNLHVGLWIHFVLWSLPSWFLKPQVTTFRPEHEFISQQAWLALIDYIGASDAI